MYPIYRTPLGVPGRISVGRTLRLPAWREPLTRSTSRLLTDLGPRISVAVQDTWPPRVLVTVTDLSIGDNVTVYREVLGERTALRGGATISAADPSLVVLDAELPFGVPVTYVAVVEGSDFGADPLNVELAGGKVALSDAITGNAAEVVIMAWPEKAKSRRSTVHVAGGRNIVVAGQRAGWNGIIEIFTETESSRLSVDDLLETATSGVLQIRQAGPYFGVDSYISVLSDTEKRWSQDGSDERRTWALDAVEVEAWAASLEPAGYTLEDLAEAFAGQTLTEIAATYATLLGISQAEFS